MADQEPFSDDEPSAAGSSLTEVILTLDLQTLAERITSLYRLPAAQFTIDSNAYPVAMWLILSLTSVRLNVTGSSKLDWRINCVIQPLN